MRRRRFGRRFRFRTRRLPRHVARQYRVKVTLLTDNYAYQGHNVTGLVNITTPGREIVFPTGVMGAWGIQPLLASGVANVGLPLGAQSTTTSIPLPRSQESAMCAILPLWNWEMYEYYGRDISMKALWGYLFPQMVFMQDQSGAPIAGLTHTIVKVRFALCALEFSTARTQYGGNILLSSGALVANQERPMPPFNVFCYEDINSKQVWWMRDWYVPVNPANGTSIWQFWTDAPANGAANTSTQAKSSGGNESMFASPLGSPRVNLRRRTGSLVRITKDTWPCLIIGMAGLWADSTGVVVKDTRGISTITPNFTIGLVLNGDLRAFLTR